MLPIKIGDKFNKLTVVGFSRRKDKRKRKVCICSCECGGEIRREASDIYHNKVKSCGCIRKKANSRWAMLGFVAAVVSYALTGHLFFGVI